MISLLEILDKCMNKGATFILDDLVCSKKGHRLSTEQNLLFSCVVNFSSQRKSYMAKEQKVLALIKFRSRMVFFF